jgi:hypothetical protein
MSIELVIFPDDRVQHTLHNHLDNLSLIVDVLWLWSADLTLTAFMFL